MGKPTMRRQTSHTPGHSNTTTTGQLLRAVVIATCLTGTLAACTSGSGGDNGNSDKGGGPGISNPGQSGGLIFSYPVDGQADVYPGSQIAFAFAGDANGKVQLVDANGDTVRTKLVNQGNGIFNLRVTDSDAALASNTQYAVKADGKIGSGNTQFKNGQTLFVFTTAPAPGAASKDGFEIVSHRGDKNDRYPLTQFNPIRARFSESVDEGSIQLCTGNEALGDDNCTVAITGPNGNVPGRLTVLGRNFVFDPGTGHVPIVSDDASDYTDQDLAANTSYKVAFSDQVHSASGDALPSGQSSFSVTPVSIGKDVIQRLRIGDAGSGNNPLNGRKRNNVELASQLIGSYDLAAAPLPNRGGLKVRLAAPGKAAYNNTFPTLLPRGQAFQLSSLKLKLGSQLQNDGTFSEGQVETPINLDNLTIQFANDVDAFITANSLRNIQKPTRVQLRLDLNISGKVPQSSPIAALSNGAVNQTALNITASGIAVPQDNGDVSLVTLGSFPIKVNRDGEATTNFELELTLPASAGDQPDVRGDQTAPFITAQYPSGCSYTFGVEGFDSGDSLSPLSSSESQCVDFLASNPYTFPGVRDDFLAFLTAAGLPPAALAKYTPEFVFDQLSATFKTSATDPYVTSLALNAEPSILFSEPVDPGSIAGNITLTDDSGNIVASRLRTEGASVVISPIGGLDAGQTYSIAVQNGITDYSNNGLSGQYSTPVVFQAEPVVVGDDSIVRQTAPFVMGISTGLPCSLIDGDFTNGGDTAGRCSADQPSDPDQPSVNPDVSPSPKRIYSVFENAVNQPLQVRFSKEVRADTIVAADGCLVGDGPANDRSNASVALQIMNGDGSCAGVVPGTVSFNGTRTDSDDARLTTGFQYTSNATLQEGQRYWLVMCGSDDPNPLQLFGMSNDVPSSQCAGDSGTVAGRDGYALNTNPLRGTGLNRIRDAITGELTNRFVASHGAGGPDLIVPFNATAASAAYDSIFVAGPVADTNGNGLFENEPPQAASINPDTILIPGGTNSADDALPTDAFDDRFGREIAQPSNRLLTRVFLPFGPGGSLLGASDNVSYLNAAVPLSVGESISSGCSAALDVQADDQPVVQRSDISDCLPITLKPGTLVYATSFLAGYKPPTGRVLLRFPETGDGDTQRGYIVPSCQGTNNGVEFSYSPCFVASLTLTANFPDLQEVVAQDSSDRRALVAPFLPQQDLSVQLMGPVAFQQNGQLTIATTNVNRFTIDGLSTSDSSLPVQAVVKPGAQTLQLVGPAIHGGAAFPTR